MLDPHHHRHFCMSEGDNALAQRVPQAPLQIGHSACSLSQALTHYPLRILGLEQRGALASFSVPFTWTGRHLIDVGKSVFTG